MDPADLGDDLVEAGVDEVGELHLGDRAQAVDRGAHRGAGDHALGQRRVEHALVAVLRPQPLGGAEDAALLADVLAQDHDALVALHLLVHGGADRLEDVQLGHQWLPPSPPSGASGVAVPPPGIGSA